MRQASPTISRTLSLRLAGVDVAVPLTISVPLSGDGFWECQFQIGWPEGIKSARARGFDGVQATYGAMRMIAVYLYASPHHKAGNLSWGRPGMVMALPCRRLGMAISLEKTGSLRCQTDSYNFMRFLTITSRHSSHAATLADRHSLYRCARCGAR
ncbi:DUF6968 family protein [Devosia psychrophila]|uniref:DUF6968 family protein n=1 Tax=Devosia psychrophila TaxID=728005 RepID=UPI003CC7A6A9